MIIFSSVRREITHICSIHSSQLYRAEIFPFDILFDWEIGNYKNQQELGDLLGISGDQISKIIKAKETRDLLQEAIPKSKFSRALPSQTMSQIGTMNHNDQIKVIEKVEAENIQFSSFWSMDKI